MLTKDWYFDDKLGAGFEKLSRRDSEVRLESVGLFGPLCTLADQFNHGLA